MHLNVAIKKQSVLLSWQSLHLHDDKWRCACIMRTPPVCNISLCHGSTMPDHSTNSISDVKSKHSLIKIALSFKEFLNALRFGKNIGKKCSLTDVSSHLGDRRPFGILFKAGRIVLFFSQLGGGFSLPLLQSTELQRLKLMVNKIVRLWPSHAGQTHWGLSLSKEIKKKSLPVPKKPHQIMTSVIGFSLPNSILRLSAPQKKQLCVSPSFPFSLSLSLSLSFFFCTSFL